jgi:hypothetical protein
VSEHELEILILLLYYKDTFYFSFYRGR